MKRYHPRHALRVIRALSWQARAIIIGLAVALSGGGLAAASLAAGAATSGCASATYSDASNTAGNYCSAQRLTRLGLDLAVTNHAVRYSRLTVKPSSDSNRREDFLAYKSPWSETSQTKVFQYAPDGVPSGLCIAVNNARTAPVLKPCNGYKAQRFTASAPDASGGVQWVSEKTGDAITDPHNGPAYTRLVLATPVDAAGQSFTWAAR